MVHVALRYPAQSLVEDLLAAAHSLGCLHAQIVHSLFSGDGGRARMWPYLNGQIPVDTSEFESIVAKLNKDESSTSRQVRNQIDKDVRRTPQTSMETCTNKLTRLLYAFASARPEIGYCQGINYLAAVIMTHITNESHILAVLLSVSDILPMYWHPSLEGTRQDTILFQHLLRENLPSLAAHFDSIGIDVNHLVMPWFLCAFTSTLPLEHATALLDLLLVESSRAILFRVALVSSNEPATVYGMRSQHRIEGVCPSSQELLRVNEVKLVQNLDGIEVMKEVMNVPTTPPPVQELINGANEYAKAGVTLEGLKKLHLVYSVQTSLPKTASGGDASMNYGLTRKMRSLEDDRRAKEEQVALLNMNLEQTAAALKEKERQLELKDAEIRGSGVQSEVPDPGERGSQSPNARTIIVTDIAQRESVQGMHSLWPCVSLNKHAGSPRVRLLPGIAGTDTV
eukprot:scaffold4120_cov400-Prasinococcus_capsulatus_cf.AAC.24